MEIFIKPVCLGSSIYTHMENYKKALKCAKHLFSIKCQSIPNTSRNQIQINKKLFVIFHLPVWTGWLDFWLLSSCAMTMPMMTKNISHKKFAVFNYITMSSAPGSPFTYCNLSQAPKDSISIVVLIPWFALPELIL